MGLTAAQEKMLELAKSCAHDWQHYDGALGYESLVCPKCHLDINDVKELMIMKVKEQ